MTALIKHLLKVTEVTGKAIHKAETLILNFPLSVGRKYYSGFRIKLGN